MNEPKFFFSKPNTAKAARTHKKSSLLIVDPKTPQKTQNSTALQQFVRDSTRKSKQNLTTSYSTAKASYPVKKKSAKQKLLTKERLYLKTAENYHSGTSLGLWENLQLFSGIKDSDSMTFYSEVEKLETDFIEFCRQDDFINAKQIIIKLLNYSIDFNYKACFLQALKKLSDFQLLLSNFSDALFYFNQTKQCALLLDEPIFLIESLIGMADCCSKKLLYNQGVIILKKALEYAWFHNLQQFQLLIYDKIGKQLFLMGDTEKAAKFHSRYIKAIIQQEDSPLKILSRQRIKKAQEVNIQKRFPEISILFLVRLSVPIYNTDQIPLLKQNTDFHLRNQYDVNRSYFSYHQQFSSQLDKIMKTWFFKEEMEQPSLPQQSWTKEIKSKKFAHVDFKLNEKLKMIGIKPLCKFSTRQEGVKYKQSLQEKIARKIKQLPIDHDWYEKLVKQIKRDHKNKLLQVRSMIRVRGHGKITKPTVTQARKIYSSFCEKSYPGS